jgi:hypothetical protein
MLRLSIALVCLITLLLGLSLAQQPAQQSQIQPTERFSGTTSVRMRSGERAQVRVVVQNWIVSGGQKNLTFRFEPQGFVIAQLRAGEAATVINGQRQQRREGEFWTVASDKMMAIETEDDSAIIQTVVIEGG